MVGLVEFEHDLQDGLHLLLLIFFSRVNHGLLGWCIWLQCCLLFELRCAFFGRIDPLELRHLIFVLFEFIIGQFYHFEESIDVVDVAFAQGFSAHVLKKVGDTYDADQLVSHHRSVAVVHVLREPKRIFFLRVFLLDLVLQGCKHDLYAFLGVLMHLL